ncbi:hypothetical protein [Novosphingobium sp. 28-62-57]
MHRQISKRRPDHRRRRAVAVVALVGAERDEIALGGQMSSASRP